jgi:hypothetical protein
MKNLFLIFTVIILLASCRKEGCTDPNSLNYEPKAKEYSAICEYEMTLIFWYNFDSWNALLDNDIERIMYYVDDELIYVENNIDNDVFTTESMACTLSENKHLFKEIILDNEVYKIEVKAFNTFNQETFNWFSFETIYANRCTTYRLDI